MKNLFKTICIFVYEVAEEFLTNEMPVYAANAALFLQIAAFPLIMLLFSMTRYIPMLDPEQIQETILNFVPAIPEISSLLTAVGKDLAQVSSSTVSWASGIVALFSSSAGVFAILKGLRKVFGYKTDSYIKFRLAAVAYTLEVMILIILGIGINLIPHISRDLFYRIAEVIPAIMIARTILMILRKFQVIMIAATFIIALALYAFPFEKTRPGKSQIPGALFTAGSWFLATRVFSFYITSFWKSSVIYGSLTAIILISFWLFIIISLLFVGAAINKVLRRH